MLQEDYNDDGLEIIAFPCNQFGRQEPKSNAEIKKFTREKYNYSGKLYYGEYLFTIDWCHPESNILDCEHSEIPHEHKCGHVMALDNGNYSIQPNNRILWNISNFTTRDDIPDYKVQTTEWNVENKGWITEDTDKMFYKIEDK